jgi:hypothetical protein
MLKISFINSAENIERMKRKGPEIVMSIFESVTKSMFRLQAFIAERKLSGEVLGVKTGKLRGSVAASETKLEGTTITGEVTSSGGPAFYGTFHEEGIPHSWQVRASKARALSFIAGGKQRFAAFVTHPSLPKRAFMKPSLDEQAPAIIADLHAAVNKVIAEP